MWPLFILITAFIVGIVSLRFQDKLIRLYLIIIAVFLSFTAGYMHVNFINKSQAGTTSACFFIIPLPPFKASI